MQLWATHDLDHWSLVAAKAAGHEAAFISQHAGVSVRTSPSGTITFEGSPFPEEPLQAYQVAVGLTDLAN